MAYQHAKLRSKIFLDSVTDITTAVTQAKMVDPVKRDIRPLLAILAAIPKADPDVVADMMTRKNSITGFEWHIIPRLVEGETSPQDIEAQRAAEIERRYREAKLHTRLGTQMNALFYGRNVIELDWGVNTRGENAVLEHRVIEAIEVKRDPRAATGLARLVYDGYESDKFILVPYDEPNAVMVAEYNPLEGIDNSHEGGLFHSILWYAWLKYMHWWYWARGGERFGVVQHPRSYANQAALDEAFNFVKEIADHSALLPADLTLMIKGIMDSAPDYNMFKDFIDKVGSIESRIILGQDVVNTAGKYGTNALGKEANKTTTNYNWSDVEWLQNIVSDQYVRVDYLMNYGEPTTGQYPAFAFRTDDAEDFKANAAILSQAAAAGWEAEDADEVSRKLGIRVKKSVAPQAPGGLV